MVMTVIKVTRGGCGIEYKDAHGNARHALKTPESGPFECDVEQAKRLIDLGVAELVPPWTIHEGDADQPSQKPEKATGHICAEQLETMTNEQLKALAADMGVDVTGCKKKADYIAAIVAVEVELGDEVEPDEDDGDELPELNAADPE